MIISDKFLPVCIEFVTNNNIFSADDITTGILLSHFTSLTSGVLELFIFIYFEVVDYIHEIIIT